MLFKPSASARKNSTGRSYAKIIDARMDQAVSTLRRFRYLPHSLETKALFIQTKVLAAALYGIECAEPSGHRMHQSVGKTSMITRFMYDTFDNAYQVKMWIERAGSVVPCSPIYSRDYCIKLGLCFFGLLPLPSRDPFPPWCCFCFNRCAVVFVIDCRQQ